MNAAAFIIASWTGMPYIATAAGAGLVARVEEKNGADLIVVYNSGLYRMKEAELLAEAGIDIIVSHVGLTAGGDVCVWGGEDGGAYGFCNRKTRSDFVGGKAEKPGYHSPVPRRADRESGGCTARSLRNLCRWVCGRIQHRTIAD